MTLLEVAAKLEALFDIDPKQRSTALREVILEIEIAARREQEAVSR